MGGTKRIIEEEEARYALGLRICTDVGLIEECEFHPGSYYEANDNLEDAYKYANSGVSSGKIQLVEGMTRRDLTDAIKRAYDDNSGIDYCPSCDRNERD